MQTFGHRVPGSHADLALVRVDLLVADVLVPDQLHRLGVDVVFLKGVQLVDELGFSNDPL